MYVCENLRWSGYRGEECPALVWACQSNRHRNSEFNKSSSFLYSIIIFYLLNYLNDLGTSEELLLQDRQDEYKIRGSNSCVYYSTRSLELSALFRSRGLCVTVALFYYQIQYITYCITVSLASQKYIHQKLSKGFTTKNYIFFANSEESRQTLTSSLSVSVYTPAPPERKSVILLCLDGAIFSQNITLYCNTSVEKLNRFAAVSFSWNSGLEEQLSLVVSLARVITDSLDILVSTLYYSKTCPFLY